MPDDESVFKAFVYEGQAAAENKTINRVGKRLNYEKSGMSSLFRKTGRKLRPIRPGQARDHLQGSRACKIDKKWKDIENWQLFKREAGKIHAILLLLGHRHAYGQRDGQMEPKEEFKQIYINLFKRTLYLSSLITFLTVVLGYPIAFPAGDPENTHQQAIC